MANFSLAQGTADLPWSTNGEKWIPKDIWREKIHRANGMAEKMLGQPLLPCPRTDGTDRRKLLLLLLNCFSRVQLCVTPWTATHQAPPSLRFSNPQQALFESERESCSVLSDSLRPHGQYSPWNSPGQNTGMGSLFPSPGEIGRAHV